MVKYEKNGGKQNMVVNYYNLNKAGENVLCTRINVNVKDRTVQIENYTDNNLERAFGVKENPDWSDFERFLEDRCFPRDRQNLKLELKKLGLNEYDPLKICKATNGRNYQDSQWLEFDENEEDFDL